MSGKEFLYSLFSINSDIAEKVDRLEELKASAIGTTASTDKEPVQSSGSKDKLGTVVSSIVDLENEINLKTGDYIKRRDFAKKLIFKIENEKYQNLLYDYFILRNPLYQVAEENEMTYDGAKSCKKRAIRSFSKLFEPYKSTFS